MVQQASLHFAFQSEGCGVWGLWREPTGYKRGMDAVEPLSSLEVLATRLKDNDNNRHPRQSFIYNTSVTDMLIYSYPRGVSVVSSLCRQKLLSFKAERQYVIYSNKVIKSTTRLLHLADVQKVYDKDICFWGIIWKNGNK